MNSRERVLTTLNREAPDRVPYFELGIDRALAQRLMGWGEPSSQAADLDTNIYSVEEARALSSFLKMDNIFYVLRAPVYAEKVPGMDGSYGRKGVSTWFRHLCLHGRYGVQECTLLFASSFSRSGASLVTKNFAEDNPSLDSSQRRQHTSFFTRSDECRYIRSSSE